MGGSAGILCAWKALVENSESTVHGCSNNRPIHALLCLAENSVGPDATRPDDVHVFYSGMYMFDVRTNVYVRTHVTLSCEP